MRYTYECSFCKKEYVEIREITDPQFFSNCECGNSYILVKEEEHE